MAYLYQLINSVPGLEGSSYQKQKQLYGRLGSPMGAYTGNSSQNVWLTEQIKNGKAQAATTPSQPNQQGVAQLPSTPTPIGEFDKLKEVALASNILKEEIPFSELAKFDEKYFNEQLVKDAINKYLQPEFEREDALYNQRYNKTLKRTNDDFTNQFTQLNENDQFYRNQEAKNFDRTLKAVNQNISNSGALFGGARKAQIDQTTIDRDSQLANYLQSVEAQKNALTTSKNRFVEDLNEQKSQDTFNTNRQRTRMVNDKVNEEKDIKYQQYLNDEKKYYQNPKYKTVGYAT